MASDYEPTPAQARLLDLLVKGLANKEIAAALNVHIDAVEHMLGRLYRATGCAGRVELSHWWRDCRPPEGGA